MFNTYETEVNKLSEFLGQSKTLLNKLGKAEGKIYNEEIDLFLELLHQERFTISVIGDLSSGKSTLLNALMGRKNDDLSPVSSDPCTSAIITYMDRALLKEEGTDECAYVYFKDLNTAPKRIYLSELRDYITESNNASNIKNVSHVDVYGNFPSWCKAANFVDCPGAGSVYEYHDALLGDFLPKSDAIIFLVDSFVKPASIDLIRKLNKNLRDKIFVVQTRIDEMEREYRNDAKKKIMATFQKEGFNVQNVYQVSAQDVFFALYEGVSASELERIKQDSGVKALEVDIEKFVKENSDSYVVLKERAENIISNLRALFSQHEARLKFILANKSEISYEELLKEKLNTEKEGKELKKKAEEALKKFKRKWDTKVEVFEANIETKKPQIVDHIKSGLGSSGFINAVTNSYKLNDFVRRNLTFELTAPLNELKSNLEECVEEFSSDMEGEVSNFANYNLGNSKIDKSCLVGSGLASAAVLGVGIKGGLAVLNSWGTVATAMGGIATATEHAAALSTGFAQMSWLGKIGHGIKVFFGGETVGMAKAGVTAASTPLIGAVPVLLLNVVVTHYSLKFASFLGQKGLASLQGSKIASIADEMVEEMKKSLRNSLDKCRDIIVADYNEKINCLVEEKQDRLLELEEIIKTNNPEALKQCNDNVKQIELTMEKADALQKEVLALEMKE